MKKYEGKTKVETVAWMMDSKHKDKGYIDLNGYRFEFDESKLQDLLTVVYVLLRQIEVTDKQMAITDLQNIVEMVGASGGYRH